MFERCQRYRGLPVVVGLTIVLASAANCWPTPSPPLPTEAPIITPAMPTHTPVPTILSTSQATPTVTSLPPTATTTASPANTSTPQVTPTDTPLPPTPTPFIVVQVQTLNVRNGPGIRYDCIGQVHQNDQLALLARNAAGDWYQVCCVSRQQGWVAAKLVEASSPQERIPTASSIPPTPTPLPVTPTFTPSPTPAFQCIYVGPTFCPGYDMGVEDSAGRRDWVTDMDGHMRMAYPGGLDWGAVFITVGPPKDPPRPGKDFSAYRSLSVELRGERGGEFVNIGIKDNDDPDDGREVKLLASGLTTSWQTFTFALSDFAMADRANKTRLYVLIELVFEPRWPAQTVYFRNVKYIP